MRILSTLLLMAAGCAVACASVIPEEQALANAGRFISQNQSSQSMRRIAGKKQMLTKALQSRGYYAFNINEGDGYVITSSSDLTQPVLGYSDHGSIDPADMPDALRYWLESLDEAVGGIEAGIPQTRQLSAHSAVARVADKVAIEPLVKAKWNQGDPWNRMTPSFVDQNSGQFNEHSATGCVATATTQIMYYWKCPQEACKEIPSYRYDWSGNVKTMPALPPVVFDWDSMTDTYDGRSSQKSIDAVAQLMLYAGCGMQSGYAGATGATSGNALNALQRYFGYSAHAYNAYHLNYTYKEWEDLFYNELAAGRPLLMGADNYERTGGHEFVCDGYDGKGLYHINWGWGGWDDGYFVLTVMAPDNQGIGGSTDANGYSMGQNVCVNLRPAYDTADEEIVRASISAINAGQARIRKDSEGVFSLNFNYNLRTILLHEYNIEHAFRLTAADNSLATDELSKDTRSMRPADRYTCNASLKLQNLDNGKYILSGISRLAGTDTWIADDNSDSNHLVLEVTDEYMNVTVMPGRGRSLKVNSMKLEGPTVAGEWQKVVYNITNTGNDFYGETYLFVDNVRSSGNTISIPAGETVDIYYKFKPSKNLGNHNFTLSYNTGKSDNISVIDRAFNIDCYWKADGSIVALPKASSTSYEIPFDATAIYVYGSKPRTLTTSTANPNVILYLDADVTLAGRVESIYRKYVTNIVFGNTAPVAAFTDGYDIDVPIPFTAETVTYTRENMPRWSTVALPFEVDEITVDDEPADWFASIDDTGKNMFVKTLSGKRSNMFTFSHSPKMEANRAYFVGVEGNFNGSSFNHTGKTVVFAGHNVRIATEGESTVSFKAEGNKMLPCFKTGNGGALYGLHSDMENFVKVEKTEQLRGYVSTSGTAESIGIRFAEGENSGVEEILLNDDNITPETDVYNLQGVKVGVFADFDTLARGIYVVGGRKVMK